MKVIVSCPFVRRGSTMSCLLFLGAFFILNCKESASWVVAPQQQQSYCRTAAASAKHRLPTTFGESRQHQRGPTKRSKTITKITNTDDEVCWEEEGDVGIVQPSDHRRTTSTRREWLHRVSTVAAMAASGAIGFSQRTWAAGATTTTTESAAKLVLSPSVCDAAVSVWQRDGRLIYLLGTAHISSTSAQTAGDLVDDVRPKAVFVELDIKRVGGASSVLGKRIQDEEGGEGTATTTTTSSNTQEVTTPDSVRWVIPQPNSKMLLATSPQRILLEGDSANDSVNDDNENSSSSLSQTKKKNPLDVRQQVLQAGAAAVGNSIKSMYQRLDQSGFQAGEEFVNAIREGQKIGAAIVLGDRDVEVTLRRLTLALSQTDLASLFSPDNELEQTMRALLPPQAKDIVEQGGGAAAAQGMTDVEFKEELSTYVETLRTKENVRSIMKQLKRVAPALYQVMLAERDAYMAGGLDTLGQFQTIVAVMGMAHVDGVEQNLQELGWKSVPLKCNNLKNKR